MRFRLKLITVSGSNFDLTSDERIHFKLYRYEQIDIGLWYMQGDDEAVALKNHSGSERVVFSTSPGSRQAVWLWAREGQEFE